MIKAEIIKYLQGMDNKDRLILQREKGKRISIYNTSLIDIVMIYLAAGIC
jgi:hypothetical protein